MNYILAIVKSCVVREHCCLYSYCLFAIVYWDNDIFCVKTELKLFVIENSDTIFKCPIAVGKNYGNKTKAGDKKTPEGTFTICSIENSSCWKHDFKDGKGLRKGAYGPYFSD